jgi:hypothetical protein
LGTIRETTTTTTTVVGGGVASKSTDTVSVCPSPAPRRNQNEIQRNSPPPTTPKATLANNNNNERDDRCHCETVERGSSFEAGDLNKNRIHPQTPRRVLQLQGASITKEPIMSNSEEKKPEIVNRVNFVASNGNMSSFKPPVAAPRKTIEAKAILNAESKGTPPAKIEATTTSITEEETVERPQPKVAPNGRCTVLSKGIHTDSPIISGVGGERARRRLLYDYKVRRDYPELFGISPRDRRSFIKSLGEKEEDGGVKKGELVTPYYYISPSPSPLPAQRHLGGPKATPPPKPQRTSSLALHSASVNGGGGESSGCGVTGNASGTGRGKYQRPNEQAKGSLDLFRLHDLLEEAENEGSDSGKSAGEIVKRQERSPEESSSNDSGISDEMVPEKRRQGLVSTNHFKLTKAHHVIMLDSKKYVKILMC